MANGLRVCAHHVEVVSDVAVSLVGVSEGEYDDGKERVHADNKHGRHVLRTNQAVSSPLAAGCMLSKRGEGEGCIQSHHEERGFGIEQPEEAEEPQACQTMARHVERDGATGFYRRRRTSAVLFCFVCCCCCCVKRQNGPAARKAMAKTGQVQSGESYTTLM